MLHGIGAETPTQLLVFVAAASVGGALAGEVLLIAFTIGLVASNTAIAIAATVGFLEVGRHPRLYVGVSNITAAFSLALGTVYLLSIDVLPALLVG
jgi:high-affinity nickel-transport protein